MRVFTELFVDELTILVADRDYDIDIYTYEAGDPEGSNEHQFVFASTTMHPFVHVYGVGNTAEEALQDLQCVVIMFYEIAMDDLENPEQCDKNCIELARWWADHWRLTTIYVPDEVADLDDTSYERWEEWHRRYDPEHIRYLVTREYEPEEQNVTFTSAGGRKTKLNWI